MKKKKLSLKDQAQRKIDEAYLLMKDAGIPERFCDMAEHTEEWYRTKTKVEHDVEYWEILNCSVCGEDHPVSIMFKKDKKHSYQASLEMSFETRTQNWGFIEKIKETFRYIKRIFRDNEISDTIFLKGDDITKLKDLLKRLP